MPFDASGVYLRPHDFTDDRDAGIKILADRMDAEIDGLAGAVNAILGGSQPFRAPVETVNGTPGAPAFSFDDDADTGMYRAGVDTLGLSAGGTGVASVTATTLNFTFGAWTFYADNAGTLTWGGNAIPHTGLNAYAVAMQVLAQNNSGASISAGATVSGAVLNPARFTNVGAPVLGSSGLSGTWRATTDCNDDEITLFMRIS